MKIDSIIFDLDGTLWNTMKVELQAINDIIKRDYNHTSTITLNQLKDVMGYKLEEAAYVLFGYNDLETGIEILNKSAKVLQKYLGKCKTELYEGVRETIKKLNSKYRLFIVSNCEKGYIETFLKVQRLQEIFEDFECSGNTGLSKGENIKQIMKRNNLREPVYIGDTQKDKEAAEFAKIQFIYAKYGFGYIKRCDKTIEKFCELLKFF